MSISAKQNPYYCKDCNDMNPRYNLDFRCEECLNIVWTKESRHYEILKEDDSDAPE